MATRPGRVRRWLAVVRTSRIALWAFVALVPLTPLRATAQATPTFSISVTEPSEIVEQVGTTRRITRADIEARNARTLDEALVAKPDGTVVSFK